MWECSAGWVGSVRRDLGPPAQPRGQPRGFLPVKSNDFGAPVAGTCPEALSQKARCAAFHRRLSAASPRDAARLRGVLRVLREWVLARSAPASPLARACALHLLCRDAGFLHDAGMIVLGCVYARAAACGCACVRALPFRCGVVRSAPPCAVVRSRVLHVCCAGMICNSHCISCSQAK